MPGNYDPGINRAVRTIAPLTTPPGRGNSGARTAQRSKNGLALTAAAAAALLFSGCVSSNTPSPTPSGPVSTAASPPSSDSTAPSGTETPAPTSTSAPVPVPAGTPRCTAASLAATTDSTGGGAAGNVSMKLILTNAGAGPCLLTGFAGVSLTAGPAGEPIGAAATPDYSSPVPEILLAPGQGGTATLQYSQAGNYPDCTRTAAAGFRIYPPEDTASLFIVQPRDACANPSIALLTVDAFQAQ